VPEFACTSPEDKRRHERYFARCYIKKKKEVTKRKRMEGKKIKEEE
jgi:hypothetical protein